MNEIWTKLSVDFWTSPEVIEIGPEASILFLMIDGYCQKYQTDGTFSVKTLQNIFKNSDFFSKKSEKIFQSLLQRLIKVGWIIEEKENLFIRNWEKWHKTKAQLEELKERQNERKRMSRSNKNTPNVTSDKTVTVENVTPLSHVTTSDVTAPDTDTDTDKEKNSKKRKTSDSVEEILETAEAVSPEEKKNKTIPRRTRFPADPWRPHKFSDEIFEFERFKAYHQAKGSVMADWDAAWRTWRLRATAFQKSNFKTAFPKEEKLMHPPLYEPEIDLEPLATPETVAKFMAEIRPMIGRPERKI